MRRTMYALGLLLLPAGAGALAHADPLYDITISQNGNSLQFTTPALPSQPVPPPPFVIEFGVFGTGVYDGTPGVSFQWEVETGSSDNSFIDVVLDGVRSTPFNLYGLSFLSRGPVIPNGKPCGPGVSCATQLFSYIPGSYNLVGEFGPVNLSINEETGPSVTPEPGTLTLLGTGMLGALGASRIRGRSGPQRRQVLSPAAGSSSACTPV